MNNDTTAATDHTAGRGTAMAEREAGRSFVASRPAHMAWLDMAEADLVSVLRNSLYPGAADESIRNVIGYCRANSLNVMLKPVHIVPMWVPEKKVDNVKVPGTGMMRDVIMPGIGHYRTQASRSGEYMGKTEPEWGPLVEYNLDGEKITVPEWCKITIRRLVQSHIVDFAAQEFWIENYATAGRDKRAPNAMWAKRSRGQLAKVTEAQALRMGFPEFTGAETAEEMEGKEIMVDRIDANGGVRQPAQAATKQLDRFAGVETDLGGTKSREPVEGGRKPAPAPAKKKAEKPAQDQQEPVDDGVIPPMPADASNDWEVDSKWAKGWRWLNETLPKLGKETRQALADEHHLLLWAVYDHDAAKGGPYSKAAQELVDRLSITMKPKVV